MHSNLDILVSIIIPCYNSELFIIECLESCQIQTYRQIEIIVIDDGSTDKSTEIVNQFMVKNSDVNCRLLSKENKGASSARNTGIKESNGTFIQFLDADDILFKDKIQSQVDLINENKTCQLIVGSYETVNLQSSKTRKRNYSDNDDSLWMGLYKSDLGNTCSNLFNASLFKEQGVSWNESLSSSQEYNLMFDILKITQQVIFDAQINTRIIRRDNNSISANEQKNLARRFDLRVRIKEYLAVNEAITFTNNQNEIDQYLFGLIRQTAKFDLSKANQDLTSHLKKYFRPENTEVNTRSYVLAYNLLGFRGAERLKKLMTR
jgi:glycosyltransferase involved in cell wall biosynthesis